MDFQRLTDNVAMPCCIIQVEKGADGTCGDIRIHAANQAYKDVMGPNYRDGMLYYELVPKDKKFEDYCFRAAFLKKRLHAYVETRAMDAWTDLTLIPLVSDQANFGYCQFLFEFTKNAEVEHMSAVSATTADFAVKTCLRLIGAQDFRKSVEDVLDDVLEHTGARGAQILLIDHKHKEVINFCERLGKNVNPVHKPDEQVISYDLIQTWEEIIGDSNDLIIKDEEDMQLLKEKNPEWAVSMLARRVNSLVLIPLRRTNEVVGYMYAVNFDEAKVVEAKEIVELISFVLGAEIYNYLLLRKLEELSMVDVLTGVRNRRAMKETVKQIEISGSKSYGVVNIDLNGLKVVNDRDGHEAGDRLLIQAGEILKKVFYQDDLFRTGGDEFIIITREITQEAFERKVDRLRADMLKNSDVSFAIGDYWSDGSVDIRTAFRFADEKMYADKNSFYEDHPELKRR